MKQSDICVMNSPSLGPLAIKRADGANASSSGGNSLAQRRLNCQSINLLCDLFSAFHLAVVVLLLTLPWLS